MTDPLSKELMYGGTVQDLRVTALRDVVRAWEVVERVTNDDMDRPGPYPPEARERLALAIAASGYGGGVVAVLGWLVKEHPELALKAACIVQDVQMNGTNEWCEDMPYPPDAAGTVAAVSR